MNHKINRHSTRRIIMQTLILLCMMVLGSNEAWAGGNTTYYYFKGTASVATSEGAVYVSQTNSDDNAAYRDTSTTGSFKGSGNATNANIYLFAKPDEGYVFDHWTKGTDTYLDNPHTASITSSSTDENEPTETTFTATFVKSGAVTAEPSDPDMGAVTLSKGDNAVGDEITLTASETQTLKGVFAGWTKSGSDDIISTDMKYTFTITDENKGKYIAKFKRIRETKGGAYYRILRGSKYVWMLGKKYIKATKSIDGFNGFIFIQSLVMKEPKDAAFENSPATVVFISGTENSRGGMTNTDFQGQGTSLSEMVKQSNYSSIDVTTELLPNGKYDFTASGGYLKDGSNYGGRVGNTMIVCGGASDQDFYLLPLCEETVDRYYLGATPNSALKVTIDGEERYLTTMYTSFPYQCYEKDGVEAYYVKEVSDGKAKLTKIDRGLVPANTGVILACKGLTAKENRLIPYNGEVTALSGNLLRGSFQLTTELNEDEKTASDEGKVKFDADTMRVLTKTSKGSIGFYKLEDGTMMTANKAWLYGSFTSSRAKISLDFNGATTGIEEIKTPLPLEGQGEAWYNLQGQKVEHPQHGVFIHNGKKVILK